ncbi:MAG: nucleotidyl transferase AbiEii/AbiGii toxin family protein [Bacilli bacterium]|jgi:hypothetical protein
MDDIVVAGGLVPALLVPQDALPEGSDAYPGTKDLDIGLALGLLDNQRYQAITDRLRSAGFVPSLNDRGNEKRQTWHMSEGSGVTIDFLIAPTSDTDRPGHLRDIEGDFAAVITPGLQLAFADREPVVIEGRTLRDERATRTVNVTGPGAYVVLKTLALSDRGENKDAYDLFYLLKHYPGGVRAVAARLAALLPDPNAQRAVEILRADFSAPDRIGPTRTSLFLHGRNDPATQADAAGFVLLLLRQLGEG